MLPLYHDGEPCRIDGAVDAAHDTASRPVAGEAA